jgi:KaiC/GvpD/RAD55 family RecA-like ATPase
MTHVLINGAPGTGKCKLLEAVAEEFDNVIWITTLSSAEFVRKKLGREDIWIIDTFTWGKKPTDESRDVIVSNPLNLNEVSLAINNVLDSLNNRYLLVMNSISGLLIYHTYQRILHFLRAILVRVEKEKSHSVFSLVKDAHEKSVEVSISMFFPNIVETDEYGGIKVIKSSLPLEKNEFNAAQAKDIIKKMIIETP